MASDAKWKIPLSDPGFGPEEEWAVQRVLRSGWVSTGPETEAFESEFAAIVGVRHAVAVSSATAALHLTLLATGAGAGSEVIQPAINFVAAANMTRAVSATPVFADIEGLGKPLIDPVDVERRITPCSRAVIAMHYGGYLCDMSALRDVCVRSTLALIEDACHAVGAQSPDGMAGSLGDAGCFSFFGNKNLAIGEGGMITTDSAAIAEKARLLRSHGMTSSGWERSVGQTVGYDVAQSGYNYRLDEIHAALGRVQLAKLAENNARRRSRIALYRQELSGLGDWILPFADKEGGSGHLMVVLAPTPTERDRAILRLAAEGIQTSIHYPCVTDLSAFRDVGADGLDASREFASRALTLPLFPGLSDEQIGLVCAAIRRG